MEEDQKCSLSLPDFVSKPGFVSVRNSRGMLQVIQQNTPRCTDVLGFYRIFQPDAVQRYEKLGGHGNAIAEAFIQRLSWELLRNGHPKNLHLGVDVFMT